MAHEMQQRTGCLDALDRTAAVAIRRICYHTVTVRRKRLGGLFTERKGSPISIRFVKASLQKASLQKASLQKASLQKAGVQVTRSPTTSPSGVTPSGITPSSVTPARASSSSPIHFAT